MVTEGKIEEILCMSSLSCSQINSQLPFEKTDISPVAVCPACYEGDGVVRSRMGGCRLEKKLKIPDYDTNSESQDR